jgi:hypothetical protein
MVKYDVTKLNVAIDQLLAVTQNPRHRFLLQAYSAPLLGGCSSL